MSKGSMMTTHCLIYDEDVNSQILEEHLQQDSIESFSLRYCRLEETVLSGINATRMITTMKFDYTDIGGIIKELPKYLPSCCTEELSMVGSNLGSKEIEEFVETFWKVAQEPRLKRIRLTDNNIEPGGFAALSKLVNILPRMECLDVAYCHLTDESLENFYSSVTGKVDKLNLSMNDLITPVGMVYLEGIVRKCNVKRFYLEVCCLTNKHFDSLQNSKNQNVQVSFISLNGNINLTPENVIELATRWNPDEISLLKCEMNLKEQQKIKSEVRIGCTITFDDLGEETADSDILISAETPRRSPIVDDDVLNKLKDLNIKEGEKSLMSPSTRLLPPCSELTDLTQWISKSDPELVAIHVEKRNLIITVRTFVRAAMTKSLAASFSWTGKSTERIMKNCFRDHPLHEFLKDVLSFTAFKKTTSEEDLAKAVKNTLYSAKQWLKNTGPRPRPSLWHMAHTGSA